MLNKRVENGYVGNAFPLSFGAFSVVLAWWLWGGGRWVPQEELLRGLEPVTGRGGDNLACDRHSPSCPQVLLRARPAGL